MPAPKGNKFAKGNKGGAPRLYKSAIELQKRINQYFDNCPDKRTIVVGEGTIEIPVYTICGLAYFLEFESRQSFYDYENIKEFTYIIKRARLQIEIKYEQSLQFSNCTGSIFALKNMGWTDKSEIDHNVNVPQLPSIIIKTKDATD